MQVDELVDDSQSDAEPAVMVDLFLHEQLKICGSALGAIPPSTYPFSSGAAERLARTRLCGGVPGRLG